MTRSGILDTVITPPLSSEKEERLADEWFEDNDIQVFVWPAQSPDLNPIKHLSNYLKQQLRKYPLPSKGVHELWDRLVEKCSKIPAETCQGLIESMPRRIQAVIEAKDQVLISQNNVWPKNGPND